MKINQAGLEEQDRNMSEKMDQNCYGPGAVIAGNEFNNDDDIMDDD